MLTTVVELDEKLKCGLEYKGMTKIKNFDDALAENVSKNLN